MPSAVAQTLGEAVALTAMLGTALKIDGKLILQTKTDGLLDFLVVNYEPPGRLRGYARYDKKRCRPGRARRRGDRASCSASGHLAMTIDPGEDMERYQGIVALDGEAARSRRRSPISANRSSCRSFMRLAVARHYRRARSGAPGRGTGAPAA